MYRCGLCNRVIRPGVSSTVIATETRVKTYPKRYDDQDKVIDNGGSGTEMARSTVACPPCAQEHTV